MVTSGSGGRLFISLAFSSRRHRDICYPNPLVFSIQTTTRVSQRLKSQQTCHEPHLVLDSLHNSMPSTWSRSHQSHKLEASGARKEPERTNSHASGCHSRGSKPRHISHNTIMPHRLIPRHVSTPPQIRFSTDQLTDRTSNGTAKPPEPHCCEPRHIPSGRPHHTTSTSRLPD